MIEKERESEREREKEREIEREHNKSNTIHRNNWEETCTSYGIPPVAQVSD